MYKVIRKELLNPVCQWVEIYMNERYLGRLLVGAVGTNYEQTDDQVIEEYFNADAISKLF